MNRSIFLAGLLANVVLALRLRARPPSTDRWTHGDGSTAGGAAGPSKPPAEADKDKDKAGSTGTKPTEGTAPTGAGTANAPTGSGVTDGLKSPTHYATQRGPSGRKLVQMGWDHSFYDRPSSQATGVAERKVLTRAQALQALAGDDPRPLLVLRECPVCNRTDDALLTPGVDNERTILLSRWFHCVKLPVDVVKKDHPFNALFPERSSEHLFLAQRAGENRVALESTTSRAELWSAMGKLLAESYSKDPAASLREIQKSLERLDVLDRRLTELEKRQDDEMTSRATPDPPSSRSWRPTWRERGASSRASWPGSRSGRASISSPRRPGRAEALREASAKN
jgi:hypothetical protein